MTNTIIAAVSENNVIGVKGNIPWKIPEDIQRFKSLTLNHPVIMGRKTFESILKSLGKPLPKRRNIVLSSHLETQPGIYVARTMEEALSLAENQDSYIIGGEQIYKLFLPHTDRLKITRVHAHYDGDAFFPQVDWNEWELVDSKGRLSAGKINFFYSFLTYSRRGR